MKKILFLLLSSVALTGLVSCVKEEKTTTGNIVFWQTKSTAQAATCTLYKFYVAGDYKGSCSATEYYDIAPDCDTKSATSFSVDLGGKDEQTVSVEIQDENGNTVYSFSTDLYSSKCVRYELQ